MEKSSWPETRLHLGSGDEPGHQCECTACVPDAQQVYYGLKALPSCFIRWEGRLAGQEVLHLTPLRYAARVKPIVSLQIRRMEWWKILSSPVQ